MDRTFGYAEVEAAQIAWEAIDEITSGRRPDAPAAAQWTDYRERVGSGELRREALSIGLLCIEALAHFSPDDRDGRSWDFDIVPAMVDSIEFDGHGRFPIMPDGALLAGAAKLRLELVDYVSRADAALMKAYGIDFTSGAGLTEEEILGYARTEDGVMKPDELAAWWGEKHDLDPVSTGWR